MAKQESVRNAEGTKRKKKWMKVRDNATSSPVPRGSSLDGGPHLSRRTASACSNFVPVAMTYGLVTFDDELLPSNRPLKVTEGDKQMFFHTFDFATSKPVSSNAKGVLHHQSANNC